MSRPPTNPKTTTFGSLSRAELMSRVRSIGNVTTELRMIALLRSQKLRGWRRHIRLPGRPDFAWTGQRLALFVDGCFWHGHNCGRNLTPKTNFEFWQEKIARNRKRDCDVSRGLRKCGWTVLRIWECQLAKFPERGVRRIRAAMNRPDKLSNSRQGD